MKTVERFVTGVLATTLAFAGCKTQEKTEQPSNYTPPAQVEVYDHTTVEVPALRYKLRSGDNLITLLKEERDTGEFYVGNKEIRMKCPGYRWGVKPSAGDYPRELGVRYIFDLFETAAALNPNLAEKVKARDTFYDAPLEGGWQNLQRGEEIIFPDIDRDGKIKGVKSPEAGTARFYGSRTRSGELFEKKVALIPKD